LVELEIAGLLRGSVTFVADCSRLTFFLLSDSVVLDVFFTGFLAFLTIFTSLPAFLADILKVFDPDLVDFFVLETVAFFFISVPGVEIHFVERLLHIAATDKTGRPLRMNKLLIGNGLHETERAASLST
jgi:hypothetical protein